MAAWEIYYWVVVAFMFFEIAVAITYWIVYAITKKQASDIARLITELIWALTLILFIVAIIVRAIHS